MPLYTDAHSDIESRFRTIEENLNYIDVKKSTKQLLAWEEIMSLLKCYVIYMMEEEYVNTLVRLSIKLAGYFYSRVQIRCNYFARKKRLSNSRKTLELFELIIVTLYENNRPLSYKVIVEAFDQEYFWFYESFCVKVTGLYITASKVNVHVFTEMLDTVEANMFEAGNIPKAKSILRIIGKLCRTEKYWPTYDQELVIKLLDLHVESVLSNSEIRNGVEFCLKYILSIVSNVNLLYVIEYVLDIFCDREISPRHLMNIAYSIQVASSTFKTEYSLWTCFKYETLKNILTLISSENELKCIFGNETFQNLLSSNHNLEQLKFPKIFFRPIDYHLQLKKLLYEDKEFIKRYRKEIHLSFLTAVKNHHNNIKILMNIFTSLSLLIVEIPCEFTAAMLVCLIMNIQKNTLNDPEINKEAAHRIHAIVISIMSLICWITNARILHSYVNSILELRAYNAPFLNPPLKVKYIYASHYILWNKPEFFFENFEVRYALWKRFRLNQNQIQKAETCDLRISVNSSTLLIN